VTSDHDPLTGDELSRAAQELSGALGRLVRRLRADAAGQGLSLPHASLLKRLEREGPATPAALARAELIRPQSLLTTVNALQEQGLVERTPHPTDGRQVLVELTDRGREQLRQRRELGENALALLMSRRLTPSEQHALSRTVGLLQRLGEDSTPYYGHPRSSEMPATALDERSALVLIDLQKRILALPTVHPADGVVQNAARLAEAFRAQGLPVVRVRVAWSQDGGDMPVGRTAVARPTTAPPADFEEFAAELGPLGDDIVITKRHWGAFTGTELDLQLRRRGVTQIVLGGIATSIGVESTARSAHEHSYHLTVVEDATTDVDLEAHAHSFNKIFPRLAETATTDEVLALLGR